MIVRRIVSHTNRSTERETETRDERQSTPKLTSRERQNASLLAHAQGRLKKEKERTINIQRQGSVADSRPKEITTQKDKKIYDDTKTLLTR